MGIVRGHRPRFTKSTVNFKDFFQYFTVNFKDFQIRREHRLRRSAPGGGGPPFRNISD
jgi:hypothetical protein